MTPSSQDRADLRSGARSPLRPSLAGLALLCGLPGLALAAPQDDAPEDVPSNAELAERLEALEAENADLRRNVDGMAAEVERFELRDVIPVVGEQISGLGPAASKVYQVQEGGVSIGGYGEWIYTNRAGSGDTWDALRTVLYAGYRFDDKWLLNSEFEFEHGTTDSSSGSTSSAGSASVEFAYLDYLHTDALNLRGGLVLIPMGFINEQHEPTTYLPAARPLVEGRIIPSTWREMGVGGWGQTEDFSWRAYVVNGLDGSDFSAGGLRGGRQKGNRAAADQLAVTARGDWTGVDGLTLGASFWYGDSANGGGLSGFSMNTLIYELHGQYQAGPWFARALWSQADIDNADLFNGATGNDLGDRMNGGYAEVGYDVLAGCDCGQSLSPYARYEVVDTQASLPVGAVLDPGNDETVTTFGLNYKPMSQIVFKLDYQDFDKGTDRWNFLMGYVF